MTIPGVQTPLAAPMVPLEHPAGGTGLVTAPVGPLAAALAGAPHPPIQKLDSGVGGRSEKLQRFGRILIQYSAANKTDLASIFQKEKQKLIHIK